MRPLSLEIPASAFTTSKDDAFEEAVLSPTSTVSSADDEEYEDRESVFSRNSSRRSSVSSVASEDAHPLVTFQIPTDNGRPIAMYASLEQAVAASTAGLENARRRVTPGKLYENEDADDEIVEDEEAFFAA